MSREGAIPPERRPRPAQEGRSSTPSAPSESSRQEALTPEQARLLPFYYDLRNEIVEPDKVVVSTQYFWTKWAPQLGPTLTTLVVCLRRHCYYNRATQERRDWCFPEQATLAREIGVETTKTIRAALSHPLTALFVRREARYVYDPARGKKVRTSDMYYVAMDDPLTPEDEALLALRAAERLLAEGRGEEATSSPPSSRRSNGQNNRQVPGRPTGPKVTQVAAPGGQSARQDSPALFTPEVVHEESTRTTKYVGVVGLGLVRSAFAAANSAPTTLAQSARLEALCRQFDEPARRLDPASSGAGWVLAAIQEAVESGSHFVAPRRIARICERWAAEGGPGEIGDAAGRTPPLAPPRRGEGRNVDGPGAPAGDVLPLSPTGRERAGVSGVTPDDGDSFGDQPDDGVDDREEDLLPGVRPGAPAFPELGLPNRAVWQAVCDEARRRLTTPGDVALLAGSQLVGRETHVLIVGVPGRSTAQRAQSRLARTIGEATRVVLGRPFEPRFVSRGEWGATQSTPADAGVRASDISGES